MSVGKPHKHTQGGQRKSTHGRAHTCTHTLRLFVYLVSSRPEKENEARNKGSKEDLPHRSQRSRGQERQATNGAKRFTLNRTKRQDDNRQHKLQTGQRQAQHTGDEWVYNWGYTQRTSRAGGSSTRQRPGFDGCDIRYKGWYRNRGPSARVDTSQHHQDLRLSYCGCHVHRAWLLGINNWIPWAKKAAGTGDKTAPLLVTLIEQHEQACTQPDGARLAAYNR